MIFRFFSAFLTGVIVAFQVRFAEVWIWSFSLVVLCISSHLLYLIVSKGRSIDPFKVSFLIFTLFFALGALITVTQDPKIDKHFFEREKPNFFIIRADETPYISNGTLHFKASVLQALSRHVIERVSGDLQVSITDTDVQIKYGNILIIPPKNRPTSSLKLMAQRSNLENHLVFSYIRLKKNEFRRINGNFGNPASTFAFRLRDKAIKTFIRYLPKGNACPLLTELITGFRASVSNGLYQSFINTGTIHVLSVSGLHVGCVYALLHFLFRGLDKKKIWKPLKWLVMILLIWFYALLTGLSPAVCRCALMISLVIVGDLSERRGKTQNYLIASAFFILVVNPYWVVDIGFQLSYLAMGGLLVFQPTIQRLVSLDHPFLDHVWSICASSVAAQLSTFPIILYYFHQFPVYFMVANLFIIPLTTVILYSGIVLLATAFFQALGVWISHLITLEVSLLEKILNFFSQLPGATLQGVSISLPFAIVSTVGIAMVMYVIKHLQENKRSEASLKFRA